MSKDLRHLARAGGLLVLVVVGILAARQLITPESFGEYGYYRGASVAEWANQPLRYSDTARCNDCHSARYALWSQTEHAGSCENCHGPAEVHIEEGQALQIDRSKSLCLKCHEELVGRPESFPQVRSSEHGVGLDCYTCHNPHGPAIAQPPAIPHPVEGANDCLACHGEGGLKPYPTNHAGRDVGSCQQCHQSRESISAAATPAPTPAPAEDETVETTTSPNEMSTPAPTPATVASEPPFIPHDLEGRADCLVCHQQGVAGAPQYPEDHAGRTSNMCSMCHESGPAAVTPSPEATPVPTEQPAATPTPVATAQPAVSGPPNVPHTLEGRSACLMCHETGALGAPTVPENHVGRTEDMCLLCHKEAP